MAIRIIESEDFFVVVLERSGGVFSEGGEEFREFDHSFGF